MTQIEQREACIRHIHTGNLKEDQNSASYEEVTRNSDVHHCIGKSEASLEHISHFVMNCNNDPTVKVEDTHSYTIFR